MLISLSCWGAWHVDMFRRLGAPSLLPQLLQRDRLVIHTLPADAPALAAIAPAAEIRADIEPLLDEWRLSPKGAQMAAWRADVDRARAAGELVALAWPDVLWGGTVLAAWRRLVGEGCSAIFQQLPRVDADAAANLLGVGRTNRELAALALNFEHHLSWAYRADGDRHPEHAELVNWRAPVGLLARMLAASPVLFDPLRHKLGPLMLLDAPVGCGFGWIGDSDDAIALSLAPAGKDLRWLPRASRPLDINRLRAFQAAYPSPTNRELAVRSYRLHAGPASAAAWAPLEQAADRLVTQLFDLAEAA